MMPRRLAGRWRIVEMDLWDRDAIDLVGPGFIEFFDDGTGRLGFIVVEAYLHCQDFADDPPRLEFTWEGTDEGDAVNGRGWAQLDPDGSMRGHIYFHNGDNPPDSRPWHAETTPHENRDADPAAVATQVCDRLPRRPCRYVRVELVGRSGVRACRSALRLGRVRGFELVFDGEADPARHGAIVRVGEASDALECLRGKRTGTDSVSLALRRRAGPRGVWFSGSE